MANQDFEKYMGAIGESTTDGAHDAVTFSGKGLGFLKDLFKSGKKRSEREYDEDDMDDELDEDEAMDGDDEREDDEDEEEEKPTRKTRKSRRTKKSRRDWEDEANGGDLEELDEEDYDEDPGQEGDEEIITNHGRRVNAKQAVKKNARGYNERRFVKSFDRFQEENEDVLDASPVLDGLAKSVRTLAKSNAALRRDNYNLGKALEALLKGQASLAADFEQIKRQPATSPASGFVVMNKNSNGKQSRRLSKSEIADVVNDAMIDGLVSPSMNSRLATLRTQQELTDFVNSLPAEVQERL